MLNWQLKALTSSKCKIAMIIFNKSTLIIFSPIVGVTANTFKKRWGGHKSSFTDPNLAGSTALSSHIWKDLKPDNINYNLHWSINRQDQPYSHVTGVCRLCLGEKHEIMFNPGQATLNQRSEFFTHCRHKEMTLLSKVKPKT